MKTEIRGSSFRQKPESSIKDLDPGFHRGDNKRASAGMTILCGLFLLFPSLSHADSQATGDTQVTGQVGVGTFIPQARMEVRMSSSDAYALQISSPNGTPMFVVRSSGAVGIGIATPTAHLDINGLADKIGNIAMQLRVGNSTSTTSSSQIVFASTGGFYAHSIVTQHVSVSSVGNSIEFFLWNSTGQPLSLTGTQALSLQAVNSTSTVSVHLYPIGTPDVQLEVSNGVSTGGGTMHRAAAGTHSSRDLKTDITYLDQTQEIQAYQDIKSLRHARFRYKAIHADRRTGKPSLTRDLRSPLMRGIIYEDAPASIQGDGKTILLDYRVANLEMALKEVNRRIEQLQGKISDIEKNRKGK